LRIVISNGSPQHIFEQIKEQIKAQIMSGELAENEMLPSLRQLAKELRLSVLTVTRAYNELEQEGFIASQQGRGFYVMPSNSELFREGLLCEIETNISKAIEIARVANMSDEEFLNLAKLLLEVKDDE
jgi:Predicted transcriptional regulators